MKNIIAAFAAMTIAALCVFDARALEQNGDIRSIDAVGGAGIVYPNGDEPLKAGQKVYILVRMLNKGWSDTFDDPSAPVYPWQFVPGPAYWQGSTLVSDTLNKPALRLSVGGVKKDAEYSATGPNGELSGPNTNVTYYTDFYFCYTVEPGDIGLPIKMLNGSEKIAAEDDTVGFYLANTSTDGAAANWKPWSLVSLHSDTPSDTPTMTLAKFYFGPAYPYENGHPAGYPSTPHDQPHRSYDFSNEGVYVKTIDFDSDYADDSHTIWREVQLGTDDPYNVEATVVGAVTSSVVYVWSSDDQVVQPTARGDAEIYSDNGNSRVLKVTVRNGVGKFGLKGTGAIGATATIYMSSRPSMAYTAVGDTLESSACMRTVKVREAPLPHITISNYAGDTKLSVVATTNVEDTTVMKVSVSERPAGYNGPITIKLNPQFQKGSSFVPVSDCDPVADGYVKMLSEASTDPISQTGLTEIVIPANEKEATFYLYAFGAPSDKTMSKLVLQPSIEDAAIWQTYESGANKNAVITLTDQAPVVVSLSVGSPIFDGDVIPNFEVGIADNVRDLDSTLNTNGYIVTVSFPGGGSMFTTNGVSFIEGQTVTLPVRAPAEGKDIQVLVTVKDPRGNVGTRTIQIDSAHALEARIVAYKDESMTDVYPEGYIFHEGETPNVRVELSSQTESSMFAYLRPLNEAASNLVVCTAVTNGLSIGSGTKASSAVQLKFLDGYTAINPMRARFAVGLRSTSEWSDGGIDYTSTYAPREYEFSVVNVSPVIKPGTMRMNTTYVENGATLSAKAPAGSRVTFTAIVHDEAAADLEATNGKAVFARWVYSDGVEGAKSDHTLFVTSSNHRVVCPITFNEEGQKQTVKVYLLDKDDRAAQTGMSELEDFDWGEPVYTFYVNVSQAAGVLLAPPDGGAVAGGTVYYNETATKGEAYFWAQLSTSPREVGTAEGSLPISETNPILIEFTTESWGSDGVVKLETTTVPFADGNRKKVFLDVNALNGGYDTYYQITAKVITDSCSNVYNQAWSDYYASGSIEVKVENVPPAITWVKRTNGPFTGDSPGSTNNWAAGESVELKWLVQDIVPDITNGQFTITWSVESDDPSSYPNPCILDSYTAVVGKTGRAEGSYRFLVPDIENQRLTMTVEDGDGGSVEKSWLIHVAASKKLQVKTLGPSRVSKSNYATAAGLGRGHVYVDDATAQPKVRQFVQEWSFNEGRKDAKVLAAGYPAVETNAYDNGSIDGPGFVGARIGPTGNNAVGDNLYNYGNSKYDNFFYTWVTIDPEQNTATAKSPSPAMSPDTIVDEVFQLDTEKQENGGGYGMVQVEAVFSREYLTSDNMGDINGDAVPDVYTVKYKGLGVIGDDGAPAGNDTDDIGRENIDEDFLPSTPTASYNSLIPGIAATWASEGRPFTTAVEIRGWDEHLNDAPAIINLEGANPDRRYTDPASDPESTLSGIEYWAFTNWCERTSAGDPNEPATWDLWSPERPSDPSKPDTDKDNMPDGYEYYFWYRAHVGYLATSVVEGEIVSEYRRQEGRKYNPANPCEPVIIDADEVERILDPIVPNDIAAETDTDNDGLPDLIELELGTNPIDYDTDGDGLPDGYEVSISLTDPLLFSTDKVKCDADLNPDQDQMAVAFFNGYEITYVDDEGADSVLYSVVKPETQSAGGALKLLAGVNLYTRWKYANDIWFTSTNVNECVWVLGERKYRADSDDVMKLKIKSVAKAGDLWAIHHHVYSEKGFDPRVGWNKTPFFKNHRVDTALYTHYDEFMSLAFFVRSGGLLPESLVVLRPSEIIDLWTKYSTNPQSADTDEDGMPDGWELYVMTGDKSERKDLSPTSVYSPIGQAGSDIVEENNEKGLTWRLKYCGVESCGVYSECGTIADNKNADWKNKLWPANPWTSDTDGDGISDVAEKTWIFGTAEHTSSDFEDCVNGGGLNPLSIDTDRDGLPDGWELDFKASLKGSGAADAAYTDVEVGAPLPNGMNPTAKDSMADYDCDGLNNWQEYMVGAMRCWRYDDVTSPWVVHKMTAEEFSEIIADDELLGQVLVDGWAKGEGGKAFNPGFRTDHFDPGVYFTYNGNAWDCLKGGDRDKDVPYGRFYMLRDGVNHDLSSEIAEINKAKYNRWTLPFKDMMFYGCQLTDAKGNPVKPSKYISCNPREADTDFDGMDDYFELYHGMNPLLGVAGMTGKSGLAFDVVFDAYYNEKDGVTGPWSAKNNYWLCGDMVLHTPMGGDVRVKPVDDKGTTITSVDFYQFPWLAGLADADPDGDNIRNQQEAIMPYVQAASTYQHIDPTPLWMTDSSYTNSLTYRFYGAQNPEWSDPGIYVGKRTKGTFLYQRPCDTKPKVYSFADFPWISWDEKSGTVVASSYNMNLWDCGDTLFDYEENEGFDTDHDYLGDFEEAQGKTKPASDPQMSDDPIRHQAMWFNGTDAFLQTPLELDEEAPEVLAQADKHQNFLYYTVEAWVLPDDSILRASGLHTVLERAVIGSESGPADELYLRKNFLIGLKDGRWYTKFDSTGTDSEQPVEIADGPFATNGWTHVAATYGPDNGKETDAAARMALRLYVNGVCVKTVRTAIQPEHGLTCLTTDVAGRLAGLTWWVYSGRKIPASILVGASAANLRGVVFNRGWEFRSYDNVSDDNPYGIAEQTEFSDYANFFKGYIDEVRIWDGARSADDILSDVENRTRYTKELADENRKAVYDAWSKGAQRTAANQTGRTLPAQLMCHWSFDHLPGAAVLDDVLTTPAGFTMPETMPDARAVWSRPEGWTCAWWESAAVRSTVFADASWVPWINNTVSHLPRFDGTTADSVYWTESWAGAKASTQYGVSGFSFPRSGESVSRAAQQIYYRFVGADGGSGDGNGEAKMATQASRWNAWKDDSELSMKYKFTLRGSMIEGADLLPMGGAFPKRISAAEGGMWDDGSPADAWAQTGVDIDNNGLPDWWEEYARKNYSGSLHPDTNFTRDTVITVDGVEMPAWQLYLRDIARGMLGDGKFYPEYVNSRDDDRDGMPDWWEDMHNIGTGDVSDGDLDTDGDGLSDFQEYLIGEYFGYALCDPTKEKTDGVTPDYFVKVGELYLGEIFTDHDQMANSWERQYDVDYTSASVYDPNRDRDGDGWSNYAEFCVGSDPTTDSTASIDGYTVAEHPVPVVEAVVRCSDAIRAPLVFKAWSEVADPGMSGEPDAIWTIGGTVDAAADSGSGSSGASSANEREKFLGRKPSGTRTYNLSGGAVAEGSIKLLFLDKGYNIVKLDETGSYITSVENGEPDKAIWIYGIYDRDGKLVLIGNALSQNETVVGSVDYKTGTITIDFGNDELCGMAIAPAVSSSSSSSSSSNQPTYHLIDQDKAYVRITWKSASNSSTGLGTYYLSDADVGTNSRGYLREGKSRFVCFADETGDGVYTPGEPYGFVGGVDVGWWGAKLEVELTRTSPVFARINVMDGSSDRATLWGTDVDVVVQAESESGSGGSKANDAAVAALSGGSWNHVRIVPYLVAGTKTDTADWTRSYVECIKCAPNRVVAEFDVNTATHPYITEADIIRDGKFDIDWDGFSTTAFSARSDMVAAVGDVTAVKYRIVLGSDGPIGPVNALDTTTVVRAFSTLVERRFEPSASRTRPSALELDHGSVLYSARPTFRWRLDEPTEIGTTYASHASLLGCSYTAFQIQVADRATGELVYDSGVQRAPIKGNDGYFSWTAPLSAGDQTGLAKVFSSVGEWKWRVEMYNAKFTPNELEPFRGWSAYSDFSTAVNQQQEYDDHGFGKLSARVKYAGHSLVLSKCENLGTTEGIVRVQAFSTPDFSGEPLAQTFVSSRASIVNMADEEPNAVLGGLKPGKYYVRAYIDSNGNRVKDDWESWGAAKTAVTLMADRPSFTADVYIEDADTDGDWLPDAYEYAKNGSLEAAGSKVDPDGKIVFKATVYDAVTSGGARFPKNLPSTSLSFFENLEAAALLLDLGSDAATDTIAAIREAVERKVTKDSLRVTGIKAANRQVEISVAANVEDSPAGALLAPVYSLPKTSTVTLSVYTKGSLVDKDWIWVNDYPVEVSNSLDTTVTVDVNEDMSNGFYKVEVSE